MRIPLSGEAHSVFFGSGISGVGFCTEDGAACSGRQGNSLVPAVR